MPDSNTQIDSERRLVMDSMKDTLVNHKSMVSSVNAVCPRMEEDRVVGFSRLSRNVSSNVWSAMGASIHAGSFCSAFNLLIQRSSRDHISHIDGRSVIPLQRSNLSLRRLVSLLIDEVHKAIKIDKGQVTQRGHSSQARQAREMGG